MRFFEILARRKIYFKAYVFSGYFSRINELNLTYKDQKVSVYLKFMTKLEVLWKNLFCGKTILTTEIMTVLKHYRPIQ